MTTETTYRILFGILLVALFAMRFFFMIKVRRTGGQLTPTQKAIEREGLASIIFRTVLFFALMAFLGMYLFGMVWIDLFRFRLPDWLRWIGFGLGLVTVVFWTWTQVTLDTLWSAQLQLRQEHHLIMTGPYARMRHPLYTGLIGWAFSLALLTANWIFVAVCLISAAGLIWRIPREEKMMIEAFGDEYKAYMQRTGRYFPKLNKE